MDFSQVCELSNLAPATVTYYIEEGIIHPLYSRDEQIESAEYADADVVRLKAAANLRRLAVPLTDIQTSVERPSEAAQIAVRHYGRLERALAADQTRLEALADIDLAHFKDIGDLLETFAALEVDLPLPDRDLNRDPDRAQRDYVQQLEQDNVVLRSDLEQMTRRQRSQFVWLLIAVFLALAATGWIIWPFLY